MHLIPHSEREVISDKCKEPKRLVTSVITTSQRLSWKEWLILLAICWLAFSLRTHELDVPSLWINEGLTLRRVQSGLVAVLGGEIEIGGDSLTDPSPPLYPIWLAGVRMISGDSIFASRMSSVWAGLLSIPLLFVLGRRLFGKAGGVAAAFLGATSPYWVWHTRCICEDSLFLTVALLSLLTLHRMLAHRRTGHYRGALWFAATSALLFTHRDGVWLLVLELAVMLLSVIRHRAHRRLLVWVTLAVLMALPSIQDLWEGQPALAEYRPGWFLARQLAVASGGGRTSPFAPLLFENGYLRDTAQAQSPLQWLRMLPAGVLLLSSLLWLFSSPRRSNSWAFAGMSSLVPLLASSWVAFSAPSPADPTHLLGAIPALYLLMGAGVAALWRRWRAAGLALVLAASIVAGHWLLVQFNDQSLIKDDLRAAAAYVSRYAQADDVVVLHNPVAQVVWDYYYAGPAPVEAIPRYASVSPEAALARFKAAAATHYSVWFLRQPDPLGLLNPTLLPNYANSQWIKIDEQAFSSLWLDVELVRYSAAPPLVEALPDGVNLRELCWPGGLCLRGWSASNLAVGSEAEVTLYWSQSVPTDCDYDVILALCGSDRQNWAEVDGPILRFYPASDWPLGQIVVQSVRIPLPPAIPPANYSLTLIARKMPDRLDMESSTGARINNLDTFALARPLEPIRPDVLTLEYESEADFGETLRLLGYNLPNDAPRPGHITFIDFYWQALATPTESWQQVTRLIDREGQVWTDRFGPLSLQEFDPLQWRAGDLVRGRVFLPLPGLMPAGEYKVEVMLLNEAGEPVPATEIWRTEATERVIAGPAYVDNWPLETEPPSMPHRPDLVFGEAIRLWGYDIQIEHGQVQPGKKVPITLVWQDQVPVGSDYHIFLHLMDAEGRLLGQSDGVPAGWTRPTSTWRAGEFIVDEHTIPVPADAPAGAVYLWVGLYSPAGDGRLPVVGADADQSSERALLDIIVIKP